LFRFVFLVGVVSVAVFGGNSVGTAGDFSGSTTFMPTVIEMLNKLMVDVGSAPVGGDPHAPWWDIFKRAWGVVDIATGVADVTGAVAGAVLAPEGSEPVDWWLLTKGVADTAFGIDDLLSPNPEQTRRAPLKQIANAQRSLPVPPSVPVPPGPSTDDIAMAVWAYPLGGQPPSNTGDIMATLDGFLSFAYGYFDNAGSSWNPVPGVPCFWLAYDVDFTPYGLAQDLAAILLGALSNVSEYSSVLEWLQGELSYYDWSPVSDGYGFQGYGCELEPPKIYCGLLDSSFDFLRAARFTPTSGPPSLSLWLELNKLMTLVPVQW
jgi:hypothetical protein